MGLEYCLFQRETQAVKNHHVVAGLCAIPMYGRDAGRILKGLVDSMLITELGISYFDRLKL